MAKDQKVAQEKVVARRQDDRHKLSIKQVKQVMLLPATQERLEALSDLTYVQSTQRMAKNVVNATEYLDGKVVSASDLFNAIGSLVQSPVGAGLGFDVLYRWAKKEKGKKKQEPLFLQLNKANPKWVPMAIKLHDVLENGEFEPSCQKVRHIFSSVNEIVQLLSVNSQDETVLEVVLEELQAGHKRLFYLLTDLTWMAKWNTAFKCATVDGVDKDEFWKHTLKLYEDKDAQYWSSVQWNEEPANCWVPIDIDD